MTLQAPPILINPEAIEDRIHQQIDEYIDGGETPYQQQYIWQEIGGRLLGVPVPVWQERGRGVIKGVLKRHVSRAMHAWLNPDRSYPVPKSEQRLSQNKKEFLRLQAWADTFCDGIERVMAEMPPEGTGGLVAQESSETVLKLRPALASAAEEAKQQVQAMRKP
ncbi:MAG: hypothetical protein V4455_07920 [Pseudomonadota bacterium]